MIYNRTWQHDITARGTWIAVRFLIKHPRLFIETIPKLFQLGLNDYLIALALSAQELNKQKH